VDALGNSGAFRSHRFLQSILFIEQPFPRGITLKEEIRETIARISKVYPVVIDESDETLESVPRALELGYAGFAIKSIKGPLKALLNVGATQCHPQRPARPIISGEDMCNLPVIPLHSDLVLMSAMGMAHVERNGHHYSFGTTHLSKAEQTALLRNHPRLYHRISNGLVVLNTESGALDVSSLIDCAGFGVTADEIDPAAMQDLEYWKFESLNLE
jgi:hypothetical protein